MKRVISGSVVTLFLFAAALQALRIVTAVGDSRQLDYGESIVLFQASKIFDLKSAFRPLAQYPHIVFHYTPLYHIAVRAVTAVLGNPLISGRLVSMTAAFWLVGLFAWVVLKVSRGYAPDRARWFAALLTGCLVLLVPAMQWAPLARVDMLGLALQFTALIVICVGRQRLPNQLAAFCLLLMGLYTKQSLLAIPAASVLLTGLIRPARAVWLACALAATGAAILLILAWVTGGGVIRHWILYNVNPFHPGIALRYEADFVRDLVALIAMGVTGFWLTLPRLAGWPRRRGALSARLAASSLRRTGVGFGLAVIFGFIVSWGIGKEGANYNYTLDWQLALCPLTGVFTVLLLAQRKQYDRAMALLRPLVAVLLLTTGSLLAVRAFDDCNGAVGLTGLARRIILAHRGEDAQLVRLMATFPGPVVSENMMVLLQAGKSIPFEPAIIKQTTATGLFDESALLKRTNDRFFDAFVLTSDAQLHFSPRMLEAIRQNYRVYPFGGSDYVVYVRRES